MNIPHSRSEAVEKAWRRCELETLRASQLVNSHEPYWDAIEYAHLYARHASILYIRRLCLRVLTNAEVGQIAATSVTDLGWADDEEYLVQFQIQVLYNRLVERQHKHYVEAAQCSVQFYELRRIWELCFSSPAVGKEGRHGLRFYGNNHRPPNLSRLLYIANKWHQSDPTFDLGHAMSLYYHLMDQGGYK